MRGKLIQALRLVVHVAEVIERRTHSPADTLLLSKARQLLADAEVVVLQAASILEGTIE